MAEIAALQKSLGSDPLDIMKFICKDLWEEIFRKKIDKLQTNHKGVFVLSDFKFKWLEKYVLDDMSSTSAATKMLYIPCGILRGALANLGLLSRVSADPIFSNPPGCTFNIKINSTGIL